jgi:hypothetical protein
MININSKIYISIVIKLMNVQDFESRYHDIITEALEEMQTATLLLAQLQIKIHKIGTSLQNLSLIVEEFVKEQKAQ